MFKPLVAAALSAGIAFTPVAAQAAPFNPFAAVTGDPLAQEVQYRGRRAYRRGYRRGVRRGIRRELRRDRRTERRLRRQRGTAAIGGVLGGLALGAIIANQRRGYAEPRYVAPRRVYRPNFSPAHHGWCSTKYRSYRSSDGTFQPYHGGRKLCVSPYL